MSKKIYLSTHYIEVYFDTLTQIGYAIWSDFCNETDYKAAILIQEKMIIELNLRFILCDIRYFRGTSVATATWTTEVVKPRLYNSSLKKIAYITGNNVFGNFTYHIIKNQFMEDGVFITNSFNHLKEAEKWLLQDEEVGKINLA